MKKLILAALLMAMSQKAAAAWMFFWIGGRWYGF